MGPGGTRQSKPVVHGIVWLASYPKSGNTWTRAFLNNLLFILNDEDPEQAGLRDITQYTLWDIAAPRYEAILGKPPTEATREEIAAARPKVQQQIADEVDGLTFVKTHNALVMDRGHPTINLAVTSGVIYIVRNPLDVAISFAHHFGGTIDDAIHRMALSGFETPVTERTVHEVYGSWSQHVLSWTRRPHRALYIMRYEDMLSEPERTFGALARHLLLTPTPDQLRRAIELSSFERLRQLEDEEGFQEKPKQAERFFRAGRAGQWKKELTPAQIQRIVRAHGAQMRRFGYLDELAPMRV